MKVWESPFIPSHLTFKKVSNFTQFHTINQIYLFIITFQNLDFWDVTTALPVSFRFELLPCIEAALEGVWLAERQSYEVQFSIMDKVQVGTSF